MAIVEQDDDLLGYEDDAELEGWYDSENTLLGVGTGDGELGTYLPGGIDAVGGPIGGPVGERVYLVSTTLFQDWNNQSVPAANASTQAVANHPIAGFEFGSGLSPRTSVTLRFASMDWVARADDPHLPSTFWDGRVIDPGSLNLTLPLTPTGTSAIETTIGRVVLDNTDAALDTLLDLNSAISQSIDISVGRIDSWVVDFKTVFHARITGIGMTETEASLDLQDPVIYAQNFYPTTVYTGLGGLGGDEDLEGVMRPVVLGRVWNMSPILINAVALIYQAHDGPLTAITGVFDGGVPLAFSANYGNFAALEAATVAAGEYATCLNQGLIRVGGTPAYALTANIDGHSAAGITVSSIAGWLVDQLNLQLEIDISGASFSSLPDWTAGWMWTEPFTFAEAISRFTADAGYHWGADITGAVRALQLTGPVYDFDSVEAYYTADDIVSLERAALPAGYEGVHHRRLVKYGKNWTVQDDSALASTAANRSMRQRGWRTAVASVSTTSRNAIDPPALETSLAVNSSALALATTLTGLHGVPRRMFSLETRIFGSIPRIGSTVVVTYPRFGLGGGSVFRVVAIDLRLAEGSMQLLLWG